MPMVWGAYKKAPPGYSGDPSPTLRPPLPANWGLTAPSRNLHRKLRSNSVWVKSRSLKPQLWAGGIHPFVSPLALAIDKRGIINVAGTHPTPSTRPLVVIDHSSRREVVINDLSRMDVTRGQYWTHHQRCLLDRQTEGQTKYCRSTWERKPCALTHVVWNRSTSQIMFSPQ